MHKPTPEPILAALDQQDYPTAAKLLKQWQQQDAQDPWFKLCAGRYQEATGKPDPAEKIYRQLLQSAANPKIVAQARQGLQRLAQRVAQNPPPAAPASSPTAPAADAQPTNLAFMVLTAMAGSERSDLAFLVLTAVVGTARQPAAQTLAEVMQVDVYTARTVLPSRGWRLYRTGPLAPIQQWGNALQQAGVGVLGTSLADLQSFQVFQVLYFQAMTPQPTVVCRNPQGQMGAIAFDWSEVAQRVEAQLPIFEQVVVLGYQDRPERREQVQDYAQFWDLHLPGRRCILRLCDSQYDFEQGCDVGEMPQSQGAICNGLRSKQAQPRNTIRLRWNALLTTLKQHLGTIPQWTDFAPFAETAADFELPLSRIQSHVYLARAESSYWDAAFHLYSGLAFLQQVKNSGSPTTNA
jgi:hypothetical protein